MYKAPTDPQREWELLREIEHGAVMEAARGIEDACSGRGEWIVVGLTPGEDGRAIEGMVNLDGSNQEESEVGILRLTLDDPQLGTRTVELSINVTARVR